MSSPRLTCINNCARCYESFGQWWCDESGAAVYPGDTVIIGGDILKGYDLEPGDGSPCKYFEEV